MRKIILAGLAMPLAIAGLLTIVVIVAAVSTGNHTPKSPSVALLSRFIPPGAPSNPIKPVPEVTAHSSWVAPQPAQPDNRMSIEDATRLAYNDAVRASRAFPAFWPNWTQTHRGIDIYSKGTPVCHHRRDQFLIRSTSVPDYIKQQAVVDCEWLPAGAHVTYAGMDDIVPYGVVRLWLLAEFCQCDTPTGGDWYAYYPDFE